MDHCTIDYILISVLIKIIFIKEKITLFLGTRDLRKALSGEAKMSLIFIWTGSLKANDYLVASNSGIFPSFRVTLPIITRNINQTCDFLEETLARGRKVDVFFSIPLSDFRN